MHRIDELGMNNHSASGSVVPTARPRLLENIDGLWFVIVPLDLRTGFAKLSAKKGKISRTCSLSGFDANAGLVWTIKLTIFLRYQDYWHST